MVSVNRTAKTLQENTTFLFDAFYYTALQVLSAVLYLVKGIMPLVVYLRNNRERKTRYRMRNKVGKYIAHEVRLFRIKMR